MALVNPTLPNDGETADAADYNVVILAILAVLNGGIETINLADNAVTTPKIVDGAVTEDKLATSAVAGWKSLATVPTTITPLGNRSYTVVFPSIDYTDRLSKGMRMRFTRVTAAPSQCTSLNGTNQYFNKTSPNKLTFTDDFAVSAWVKLTSYGVTGVVASRSDGTSGWYLYVNTTGQVVLTGQNAGGSNISYVTSYRSIPIGKWVHIAAQLDMSAFTATTTTSYVMIDGLDVGASVTRGGSNPTALVQAGNLEIGTNNGGLNFFPGKLAQVAVYNAKVSQSTMLGSMNQALAGTETSLASAYSFSNSITDLNTSSPNNLTANGSAVATSADSPFAQAVTAGLLEYGIITGVSVVTDTTVTVQIPEGSALPSSGGASAAAYSGASRPYLFPASVGKWTLELIRDHSERGQSSPVSGTWYNPTGLSGIVPVGAWSINRRGVLKYLYNGTTVQTWSTLSTANNSESNTNLSCYNDAIMATSATQQAVSPHNVFSPGEVDVAAATPYYLNMKTAQGSVTTIAFGTGTPNNMNTVVQAVLAYL